MRQTLFALILFLFLMVHASSCGYRMAGRGKLPGGVSRVSVGMFENRTVQEEAGQIFSKALVQELVRFSHGNVVTKSRAQAFISGVVRSVSMGALTRSSDDSVLERRITVVLDMEMRGTDGELIWSRRGISHEDVCRVSQVNVTDEEVKKVVLGEMAQRVAQRIVGIMTDDF